MPRRERGFSEVIIDIFSLHRGPVPVLFALPSSPLRLNAANRWAPSPSPRTAVRLKPDSGGGCSENTCRLVGTRPSNSRGGTFAASTIRTKRLFTPLSGSGMRRRFFTSFSRASWDQQSSGLLEHVSRGEWPSTQCCDRRLREVLATYPYALNARNRRNSTSSSLDVVLKMSTTTLVRRAP